MNVCDINFFVFTSFQCTEIYESFSSYGDMYSVQIMQVLTNLCVHHRWLTVLWACGLQSWPELRQRLLQLLCCCPHEQQLWPARRWRSERSSPRWRKSWEMCPRRRVEEADTGLVLRAAAGASPWPGMLGSWWSCWNRWSPMASASPSCSHWASWLQSCCRTDVGASNSWWCCWLAREGGLGKKK